MLFLLISHFIQPTMKSFSNLFQLSLAFLAATLLFSLSVYGQSQSPMRAVNKNMKNINSIKALETKSTDKSTDSNIAKSNPSKQGTNVVAKSRVAHKKQVFVKNKASKFMAQPTKTELQAEMRSIQDKIDYLEKNNPPTANSKKELQDMQNLLQQKRAQLNVLDKK
jgi:hypothetical protein